MSQLHQLGADLPQGGLAPVVFNTELVEKDDQIENNIAACLGKPYRPFTELLCKPFQGPCSIVGSGPSVDWTWKLTEGDVIACNAAHDFLIRRGKVPKYAMLWDPVAVLNDFMTPHDDVTYLVASRCHPSVFKRLEKSRVIVWHAAGDLSLEHLLKRFRKMEPIIMGGSTAVMRSLFLAVSMGHLDVRLFGIDSSFDGSNTHLRKSVVREDEMNIYYEGQKFRTAPWLAVQAEDFKKLAPYLTQSGVRISIYGDGLVPAVAKSMGYPVISQRDHSQGRNHARQ